MKYLIKVVSVSGPAGPVDLKPIDFDIDFDQGYPKDLDPLLHLEKKTELKDEKPAERFFKRGGSRSVPEGLIEGPKVDDQGFPFSGKPIHRISMRLDEKLPFTARVQAKTARIFFQDFLRLTKDLFPGMLMAFPKPPTYHWNPKEGGEEVVDAKKVKDLLKIKFPNLRWGFRSDGTEASELGFPDGSYVEMILGLDANLLTVIYNLEEEVAEV